MILRTRLDKRHAVEDLGLWSESDHAPLLVPEPSINLHPRGFSIELNGQRERHTMFRLVSCIFRGIELDTLRLL